ncbi:MAG: RNA polymerase subunit sigma-70, partial [Pseudomonadota bacterium]
VRARALLVRAQKIGRIGRFQLEAAIQAVHADRMMTGRTDWRAIAQLYEGLLHLAPTLGAAVGRAAAVGRVAGPEAGLRALEQVDPEAVSGFQPYWAARAHLLKQAGDDGATAAYEKAISLTTDPLLRQHLETERDKA